MNSSLISSSPPATVPQPTKAGATQSNRPQTTAEIREKARDVAQQFEQVFVQQMVEQFRNASITEDSDGMFGSGPGSSTYASWFDTHMSEHMSSTGQVGMASAMMRYLEQANQIPAEEKKTPAVAHPASTTKTTTTQAKGSGYALA